MEDFEAKLTEKSQARQAEEARRSLDGLLGEPVEASPAALGEEPRSGPFKSGDATAGPLQPGQAKSTMAATPTTERERDKESLEKIGDVARGITELPGQAIKGAIDSVNEFITTGQSFGEWLEKEFKLPSIGVGMDGVSLLDNEEITQLRQEGRGLADYVRVPSPVGEAQSATGEFFHDTAKFISSFAIAGKQLQAIKPIAAAGKYGKLMLQGAIADFAGMDPYEQKLSDFVQKYPALQNPVTEFLSGEYDDNEFELRLKRAAEGAGLGVLTEGAIKGLSKSVSFIRNFKAAQTGADKIIAGVVDAPLPSNTSALDVLGSVEGPRVSFKSTGEAGGEAAVGDLATQDMRNIFINFARIDSTDDIKTVMQRMANKFRADINAGRRGVRTHAETEMAAGQIDAWDLLTKRKVGETFNAEQTQAARELWVTSSNSLHAIAAQAAENPSEANLFAFKKMTAVHQAIQREVIGARTETARALNAWKIPAGSNQKRLMQMAQALEMEGSPDAIRSQAKMIAEMSEAGFHPEIDKFLELSTLAKTRRAVHHAWLSAMLTSPHTHARNFISNTSVLALAVGERKLASVISQGAVDGVAPGEAAEMAFGMIEGAKDALRLSSKARKMASTAIRLKMADPAGQSLRRNLGNLAAENPEEFGTTWREVFTGKGGVTGERFEKYAGESPLAPSTWGLSKDTTLGRAMDVIDTAAEGPYRALAVSDDLFRTLNYNAELRAQALRQAREEVSSGKIPMAELKNRLEDLRANPTDAMKQDAERFAIYNTFAGTPAKVPYDPIAAIGRIPIFGPLLVPFKRTPVNLLTYSFERTPMAPLVKTWRNEFARGGAGRDLAMSKMAGGSAMMLAFADMAMSGILTGDGPASPEHRQLLRREGIQPSSIRIPLSNGEYRQFSIRGLEPIASTALMAANVAEILKYAEWDDPDESIGKVTSAATIAIASQITSPQYMKGISDFFQFMHEPNRYGDSYIQGLVGTVVPAGVNLAHRINDPYMRYATGLIDSVKARTPGLSADLPYYRDLWGRPVTTSSALGPWYDATVPLYSRDTEIQPIDAELERLEHYVRKPSSRVRFDGINIDLRNFPKAYDRYLQLAGNDLTTSIYGAPVDPLTGKGCMDTLNDLVTGKHPFSQIYDAYGKQFGNDDDKAEYIDKVVRSYRDAAKDVLLTEFDDLAAEVSARKAESKGVLR